MYIKYMTGTETKIIVNHVSIDSVLDTPPVVYIMNRGSSCFTLLRRYLDLNMCSL